MIDRLLSLLAPHLCSGCEKPGSLLCDDCKYNIIDEALDGCLVCGEPSGAGICSVHHASYEKAWYVGERGGALQRLIGNYKFQNARSGFKVLTELLHERLPSFDENTIIVPVPTVAAHIRERGYDHVALVAKQLARLRGLVVQSIVARQTATMQRHAHRTLRQAQAEKAFRLAGSVNKKSTYLIVDDVATTGATVEAMAKVLRGAGARRVWVAVVARQPLD